MLFVGWVNEMEGAEVVGAGVIRSKRLLPAFGFVSVLGAVKAEDEAAPNALFVPMAVLGRFREAKGSSFGLVAPLGSGGSKMPMVEVVSIDLGMG